MFFARFIKFIVFFYLSHETRVGAHVVRRWFFDRTCGHTVYTHRQICDHMSNGGHLEIQELKFAMTSGEGPRSRPSEVLSAATLGTVQFLP